MLSSKKKRALASLFVTMILFVIALTPAPPLDAADHGDSPAVANDQGGDIADSYIFLDPNDNSRVIIAGTIHGFIVPNEMVNFGIFDENIRYRFELELTGDARPDRFIDIRFTPKTQSSSQVQTATITLPSGQTFNAPGTVPTLDPEPPAPVITTNQATGVQFFAGVVDDPFNFDITGFSRYAAPARNGTGLRRARTQRNGAARQKPTPTRSRQLRGLQHSRHRSEFPRFGVEVGGRVKRDRTEFRDAATQQPDRHASGRRHGHGSVGHG